MLLNMLLKIGNSTSLQSNYFGQPLSTITFTYLTHELLTIWAAAPQPKPLPAFSCHYPWLLSSLSTRFTVSAPYYPSPGPGLLWADWLNVSIRQHHTNGATQLGRQRERHELCHAAALLNPGLLAKTVAGTPALLMPLHYWPSQLSPRPAASYVYPNTICQVTKSSQLCMAGTPTRRFCDLAGTAVQQPSQDPYARNMLAKTPLSQAFSNSTQEGPEGNLSPAAPDQLPHEMPTLVPTAGVTGRGGAAAWPAAGAAAAGAAAVAAVACVPGAAAAAAAVEGPSAEGAVGGAVAEPVERSEFGGRAAA
ncbi:hypothetical protein HaLaN_20712, partial [Haematococcus lacustris]